MEGLLAGEYYLIQPHTVLLFCPGPAMWHMTHSGQPTSQSVVRLCTMTATKMQSYKSIKRMDLTLGEIDAMLRELFSRGMLQEVVTTTSDEQMVWHVWWTGSMDNSNPAHPRSSSVMVGPCSKWQFTQMTCLKAACSFSCTATWQVPSRGSLEFNPLRLLLCDIGCLHTTYRGHLS